MDYLVTVNGEDAYSFKSRSWKKVVEWVSLFVNPDDWFLIEAREEPCFGYDKVWREVFVGEFGEFEYLYKNPNSKKGRK